MEIRMSILNCMPAKRERQHISAQQEEVKYGGIGIEEDPENRAIGRSGTQVGEKGKLEVGEEDDQRGDATGGIEVIQPMGGV